MRTYPSSEDVQGATYYYYPSSWIQFQDCTYSAQFPLPREHSLPSCLSWQIHTYPSHPTGYPFNVDKVSCWRTEVPGIDRNRTATLWSRVKGSLQYTTAPPAPPMLSVPRQSRSSTGYNEAESWDLFSTRDFSVHFAYLMRWKHFF